MFIVTEHQISENINSFTFDRIIQNTNAFELINKIIKQFTGSNELFFVNYRVDGFNISAKKMNEYYIEIPRFFLTQGEYCCLNLFNIKSRKFGEGLTVCRCVNNDDAYGMIEKIFNYFLETTLFCSKLSWNTFVEFSENYMKHAAQDYISNGFTDILFLYTDSGDFSILFDTHVFSAENVHNQLDFIIESIEGGNQGTVL